MSKRSKTTRDRLSDSNKMLTNLLLWEASGGIISLPKGAENYTPPPIPFTERRALIDSVNKQLMVDMKLSPDSEESGFEMLKEELNASKRNGKTNGSGGNSAQKSRGGESEHELHASGNSPETRADTIDFD